MEKEGATLEKKRLPMAACWRVISSAFAPMTVMGSWGCASGEPMVMGGSGVGPEFPPEDTRRKASSLFGVVGRETGGVGGTSPVASARLSKAWMSIRSAASADIEVMSHCSLVKISGSSDFSMYVGSTDAAPVSALGEGGGGGVRGAVSTPSTLKTPSSMPCRRVDVDVERGVCCQQAICSRR